MGVSGYLTGVRGLRAPGAGRKCDAPYATTGYLPASSRERRHTFSPRRLPIGHFAFAASAASKRHVFSGSCPLFNPLRPLAPALGTRDDSSFGGARRAIQALDGV